jgi:tRNA threonylcarbamoyladenosine biosynthesis protein TsaB
VLLFAIDTATEQGSLALADGDRVLGESTLSAAGTYLQHLLPGIEALLAGAGCKIEEIQGLVVCRGPGNFTGLRIGLATAKALAWALNLPLAAVSTLTLLAAAFPFQELPVGVLVDAKRQERDFRLYDCTGAEPQALGDARRLGLRDLAPALAPPVLLTGTGLEVYEAQLRAALPPDVRFAPPELRFPRAATLARLGGVRLARGGAEPLESLTPTYLRPAL